MVVNFGAGTAYGYTNFEKRTESAESSVVKEQSVKVDEYSGSKSEVSDDKSKYVNLPTKKYIDAVIKSALKNIEMGINVDENKRLITIFSNIINEEPAETMSISYTA